MAPTNLLPLQTAAFKYLWSTENLIVLKTDKNLGPAVMQHSKYIQLAYDDHLSHQQIYCQLNQEQATLQIETIKKIILRFIDTHLPASNKANTNDRKYLQRIYDSVLKSANDRHILPISHFYLLAKIHKVPLTTRPIVSVSGSLLSGLGKWVDYKLQELIQLFPEKFPYYISSSTHLIQKLKTVQLPPSSLLCSANAISMYTNINTGHALCELHTFFKLFLQLLFTQGYYTELKLSCAIVCFTLTAKYGCNFPERQWELHQLPCMPLFILLSKNRK